MNQINKLPNSTTRKIIVNQKGIIKKKEIIFKYKFFIEIF